MNKLELLKLVLTLISDSDARQAEEHRGTEFEYCRQQMAGSLAPTILFGVIGSGGFPNGSFLILTLGVLCSVFDLTYIWLFIRIKHQTS